MKTAEEWIQQHGVHARWGDEDTEYTSLSAIDIQQIQLDAMKEGMRRAANLTVEIADNKMLSKDAYVVSETIFTAAEQLTEKDL